MGWTRMIWGEKMPDRDDPKYKDRYEREVETGRRFAKATRLDRIAANVQGFANGHRNLFLALVFGLVLLSFGVNVAQTVRICRRQQEEKHQVTAIRHQEQLLRNKSDHTKKQEYEDCRQD